MNKEGTLYSTVYDMVMRLLVEKRIDVNQIEDQIDMLASTLGMMYPDEYLDKEAVAKRIIFDYGIFQGSSTVLKDNRDHKAWLADERASIKWNLWMRYRKYLEVTCKFPPSVVKSVDETTSDILGLLESPRREGAWDRRGMVVGNVQSGKTSNYTGLMCKAVDAGYKVIIVLAGLNNDLRSQTQKRIDKGFLGKDTTKNKQRVQAGIKIGAGLLPGFQVPIIHSVTSAESSGDYKNNVYKAVTITPGGDPVIAVVKKNVTPLKNLYEWFSKINESGKINGVPLLLIDDEADNASINTKAAKQIDKLNPEADEQDPTKINGYIRKILNCFDQSAYVGYTATPFANIFIYPIDPDNAKTEYGEDLYPRSFIVNLHAPSNYIGPEKVFGLEKDKTAHIEEVAPLPLIRIADDCTKVIPEKHKTDLDVHELPDTLYQAVYAFILSAAAREVRGQGNKHHSMLIHVTRYVSVQQKLTELMKDEMRCITEQLEFKTGPKYEQLILDMEKIWNEDFVPTTEAVMRAMEDPGMRPISWDEIKDKLYSCASKIEVKAVNGKASDGGIDYDSYPNGCKVIAIGGDKLSRGLTLEGLTISYYSRLSKMYDTLLQMGRWFGYRDGYADLCRLYISSTLAKWYRHIAVANEELRRELDDMAAMGATPERYGLKVRTHPDGMLITALNKMRNSEVRTVTYAGELVQITKYYKKNQINKANCVFADEWLRSLGDPIMPSLETKNNYLWKHVKADRIVDFLGGIAVHPYCFNASPKIVSDYINSQVADGELTDWTVALVSVKKGNPFEIAGQTIGRAWRTDDRTNRGNADEDTIYIIRNNLITESDQDVDLIDVTPEEYDKAMEQTIAKWEEDGQKKKRPTIPSRAQIRKCKDKTKGLLLIYLFRSGTDEKTDNSDYDDVYLGYALSFPGSDTAKAVEYKVDEVYVRYEQDDE